MPTAPQAVPDAHNSPEVQQAIADANAQGADALAQAKKDMAARTGAALGNHAKNTAIDMIKRRIRDYLKPHLPYFLQPLLPGVGGSVSERAGRGMRRWVSRTIWGAIITAVFSIVFFAVFAAAILLILGIVFVNMPG